MSGQTTTPSSAGPAPWRALFQRHVSQMSSPEFVFTSLHGAASEDAPVPYVPRARTCIFRGFFAELPENKHNEAPRNEHVFESDLLTLTTDVRMQKVPELFSSSAGKGRVGQSQGSGGGGPVEAVFWCREAMTQWRIRGEAFVVAMDIEGSGDESSGTRTVKSEVGKRMRVVKEEAKDSWSWAKELTAHFGNLSPTMRGSFKNPPPGSPVSIAPSDPSLKLGQKVTDLHDKIARENFRLIIIKPDEVEQVDLSNAEEARRWNFTHVGPNGDNVGGWKKEELWP